MNGNGMNLTDNEVFKLGVEEGRKQVMDHIQHQCSIGKPIEANGELYWLQDARCHLVEVMDGIDNAWNEEHGLKRFIVPIKRSCNNEEISREVIIQANKAETALVIAMEDFQNDGWTVNEDYEDYRQLDR